MVSNSNPAMASDQLRESYVAKVNAAQERDDDSLSAELADRYLADLTNIASAGSAGSAGSKHPS